MRKLPSRVTERVLPASRSTSCAAAASSGQKFSSSSLSTCTRTCSRAPGVGCAENVNTLPGENAVRSEEHTSELQSLMRLSYAVFCLKKKKQINNTQYKIN